MSAPRHSRHLVRIPKQRHAGLLFARYAALACALAALLRLLEARAFGEEARPERFLLPLALGLGLGALGTWADVLRRRLGLLASTDGLTGVFNRNHCSVVLGQELERCRRHGSKVSLIMVDIDHFKALNDKHGRAAGDRVLRRFVEILRDGVRATDTICRVGGEEFIIICVEADQARARSLAERLRAAIQAEPFGGLAPITASLGVAQMHEQDREPSDLLQRVDGALYEAKRAGCDRVVAAGDLLSKDLGLDTVRHD